MKSKDIPLDGPGVADAREDSLWLLEFQVVRGKLAGYTTFAPAKDLALELLPSYPIEAVFAAQRETAEARRLLERGATIDLTGARDLRQPFQRAALGGVLTGEELRDVHDTLAANRVVRSAVLRHMDVPTITAVAGGVPVLPDLEKDIAAAVGRSGEVLDVASPELRDLRVETRLAYQRLMDSMERAMRRIGPHNVLQEPLITQRNGRMVLLVKSEMKHRLPGIVHDVSDSGATVFVEPMSAVGLGNLWRELRLAEEREEQRVLRALSARVEGHSDDLLRGIELLAQLDFAMAKARYAIAIAATPPTMLAADRQLVRLVEARHPLLEGDVVPVTVKMGNQWSVLVITGPNAGGKTVALKTVGLLALMAQAGLHLPAREATLSPFDAVYADIGDQQSIQRSLSTFSSHVMNLKKIAERATERSLVLIDELGTSTDPEEGSALAKAVLRYFARKGVTLLTTTHHREVAAFAQGQPGMMNASVELDPRTFAPTYRLTLGLPGRSYALTIASRLGLDDEIVGHARELLSPGHKGTEDLLKELQEERMLAEEAHKEAEGALERAEKRGSDLKEELASLRDTKAGLMEEARAQIQRQVEEITQSIRKAERAAARPAAGPTRAPPVPEVPVPDAPVLDLPIPDTKEARRELSRVREELRSPEWQPPASRRGDWLSRIKAGDRVYMRGVPRPVEVITPPGDEGTVEVLLGTMRARLPAHQLDRPAPAHSTASGDGVFLARAHRGRAATELDLHGVRVEDALERMEGFLNDAAVDGLRSVRVMHGVGTGALRSAVREYLNGHPLVKSAGRDEGIPNDGATVVELA